MFLVGGRFLVLVGDSPDGGRASWCWWVIGSGGGRCVPRRWECLLVLVGIFQTDPGRGQGATYQCGGPIFLANQSSQDRPHKCIALNINYLFSPLGYAVQRQYIGEMVIVLKV